MIGRKGLAVAALIGCFSAGGETGSRADALPSGIVGAWTTTIPDCARVFTRRTGRITYRQPVDKFAQAAIIEPQTIYLPSSTCHIQQVTHASGAVKLNADCQDSISYTSQSVEIKVRSNSEIVYSPTGDPTLDTTFIKCPL